MCQRVQSLGQKQNSISIPIKKKIRLHKCIIKTNNPHIVNMAMQGSYGLVEINFELLFRDYRIIIR